MPDVMPLRTDEPRRLGRYRLTGHVGDLDVFYGGAGVFLAKRVDGVTVVVTMLGTVAAANAAARDRFTAEARAARRVPPFCTARILDAGLEGDRAYLVTEFVPGPSLAEVVRNEGPLPPDTVRAVAVGCATGLSAIHQSGLVHGSLRPEVVILGPEGPRVVQFSITPPYGAATPAADMLAWAHTVVFAAGGRPAAGPQDLAALPDDLRTEVAACFNPEPSGRPAARAVLAALISRHGLTTGPTARLLAEGSRLAEAAARSPASIAPVWSEPPRRRRSRVGLWVAACAACLLAIAAAAAFIADRGQPSTGGAARTPTPGRPSLKRSPLRPRVPAQFAGRWSGTVHQTDPVLSVIVHISLTEGSAAGTVAYPPLRCMGSLTVVSATQARLTLRQMISNTGQTTCENGLVTLTPHAGKLTFTFARPGGNTPTGTLSRQP